MSVKYISLTHFSGKGYSKMLKKHKIEAGKQLKWPEAIDGMQVS